MNFKKIKDKTKKNIKQTIEDLKKDFKNLGNHLEKAADKLEGYIEKLKNCSHKTCENKDSVTTENCPKQTDDNHQFSSDAVPAGETIDFNTTDHT